MPLEAFALDEKLTYEPQRIVTIIGASRSGTTVIKHALALHPDLCSLAGEEEPYYKLSGNGYPWHASDEFHEPNQPELIRLLIANELHNHNTAHCRYLLQKLRIEEPPFVEPITARRTETLLLKTPQNCYRHGVLRSLYPTAEIIPLVVRRDHRATVNGLIDGWRSGQFTARWTPEGWWCFDMPPGWSWRRGLLERCVHQWATSQQFIDTDYPNSPFVDLWFEEFQQDWQGCCQHIWDKLGLARWKIPANYYLPVLSATDRPQQDRWRIKRPWLIDLPSDPSEAQRAAQIYEWLLSRETGHRNEPQDIHPEQ